MLDRATVQQFYARITGTGQAGIDGNQDSLTLLTAHPELTHVRFWDYEVGSQGSNLDFAIHLAILFGKLELTEQLIALGADVNLKDSGEEAPLSLAQRISLYSFEIKIAILERLLKAGADPNQSDQYGDTVLHSSMADNRAATIVPLLLRYGADPNRRNKQGRVPLHFWRKEAPVGEVESHMEVLHVMMAHGADIKAADNAGETLLIHAITAGCNGVEEMIGYGADVHAKTKRRWTAMHAAAMAFDAAEAEDIAHLLKAGASCHVKEYRGYTPLHVAAALCGIEAARLLLEAGADINARSYRRETPLALVDAGKDPFEDIYPDEEDYERMADFLREHGATPTPGNVQRREQPPDEG